MKLIIVFGCIVAVTLGAPSAADVQKTIDNVVDQLQGTQDSVDIGDQNLKTVLEIDSTLKNGKVSGFKNGFKRTVSKYDEKTKKYSATIEIKNTKVTGTLDPNTGSTTGKTGALECTVAKISGIMDATVVDADSKKIQLDDTNFSFTLKLETSTDNKCKVDDKDDDQLTTALTTSIGTINKLIDDQKAKINAALVLAFNTVLAQGAAFASSPFALLIVAITAFTYLI